MSFLYSIKQQANRTQTLLKLTTLLSLLFFASVSWAKQVTIQTDRQTVETGDIITLLVEADFQTKGSQLNTDILKDQFEVLNQQQSNQIEIINGSYNSFTRWRLQLLPKQEGKLIIPPFELGGVKSKPYTITVVKAQYTDANRPYFLEAKIDKKQVFVQEQVIYTLRFFHKGSLINGNIRPPEFADALTEQLKEQSVYGKTINGQQYTVYEWQYALFPQSSGQLTIPGPSFTGLLQLRGKQKGVRALADTIEIAVSPKVENGFSYWLPASSVKLSQKWDNLPQTVHVGDSLQRVITLEVKGLKSTQLPDITTQNGANFKVYPDESRESQTLSDDGVTSVKLVTQAIVPSQQGTLQLPEINFSWWNTETKQIEQAVLKSEPLTVWPADASIPPVTQANNATAPLQQLTPKQSVTSQASQQAIANYQNQAQQQNMFWPAVVAVLATLWLLTLLLLLNTRKQLQQLSAEESSESVNNEIKGGAKSFNKKWCDLPLNEFYSELLRQLHHEFDIPTIDAIPNTHLRAAVYQLESHLFAGQKLGYDTLQTICDNWSALYSHQHESKTDKNNKKLADLYNK